MSKSIEDALELCKAGEALKLPFFLEEILIEVRNRIGCEAGSILLLNEASGKLEFKVTEGTKSTEIKKLRVDPKEGVAGWVFRKAEPLVVNNTERDIRFSDRFDDSTGYRTRSILAAPLKVGEKIVGVFELLNKQKGRFSQEDIGIVLSYASIASVVVENIELYKSLRLLVQRLRNLQDYQKVLLESLTDGVLSIDCHDRIVSCNKSVEVMLEKQKQEILNKNLDVVFDSKDQVQRIIGECQSKGRINNLLCHLRCNGNQKIPVAVDATAINSNETAKGVVLVIRNLRNAINKEEIKREVILNSDLLPNISHEFNTPLTAIQAGIQLLKQQSNGSSASYIGIVHRNVETLKERIQAFLDYLKAERDEWTPRSSRVDVNEFMNECLAAEKRRFPQNTFVLSMPKGKQYIFADWEQLVKCFDIVIKNAVQYSHPGSSIRIAAVANGKLMHFYFADEGSGISSNDLIYLFKKFRRFSNSINETSSGLGIGLWLARYLIRKNSGRIAVKSKEGKGTIVRISFPKCKEIADNT
jgi:NtrC-family two-component system sensor histidine kinase KinB